jgi:hypothetical protein
LSGILSRAVATWANPDKLNARHNLDRAALFITLNDRSGLAICAIENFLGGCDLRGGWNPFTPAHNAYKRVDGGGSIFPGDFSDRRCSLVGNAFGPSSTALTGLRAAIASFYYFSRHPKPLSLLSDGLRALGSTSTTVD